MAADTFEVQLKRMETSQPWGFRLRGGTDQGMQLFVEHVRIIMCACMRHGPYSVEYR